MGSGSARSAINPIEEISSRLLRDSGGDPASLSHSPLGTPHVVPHSPHGQGGINSSKFLHESPLTRESRVRPPGDDVSLGLFADSADMLHLPVHSHQNQHQNQHQHQHQHQPFPPQQQLLERKGSFGSLGSDMDMASFISESSGVTHFRDFDDSIGSLSGPRDRRGQDSTSMSMSSSSLSPQGLLNVGKARVPRKAIPQILHSTIGLVAATSPLRGLQQTGMQSIRPSGIPPSGPSGAAAHDEGPGGAIGVRYSVGPIEAAGRGARDKGSHLKGQGRSKQPGGVSFAVGPSSSQNQQLR